jgi:hypothetical protein
VRLDEGVLVGSIAGLPVGESVKRWPDNGLQVIGVSVVCLNLPRGALEAWIAALVPGKLYLSSQGRGKSIVSH